MHIVQNFCSFSRRDGRETAKISLREATENRVPSIISMQNNPVAAFSTIPTEYHRCWLTAMQSFNGFLECRCFLIYSLSFFYFFRGCKEKDARTPEKPGGLSAIPTFSFNFNLCGVLSRTWFFCQC